MKKNKRLCAISLILTIALFFGASATALAAEESDADSSTETIEIQSVEDLQALAKSCRLDTWSQGKTVELTTDLSLEGTEFSPIPSFGGVFHGNGHAISGLNLDGSASRAGLFDEIQEGGAVYRLSVSGTIDVTGNEAAGGIAAVNGGAIVSCDFSGSVSGASCVGGIVGQNTKTGNVTDCRSKGAVMGEKMTGGVAGRNDGKLARCVNAACVNGTSADRNLSLQNLSLDFSFDLSKLSSMNTVGAAADTGGVAGYSCGVILSCENTAAVGYPHVGYNVGGIVGRSCGFLLSSKNSGTVNGRKDVGGIAGQAEPYIEMTLSQSRLETLQNQLSELNALIDKAANDVHGGANGITSRLNSMNAYVRSASSSAADVKLTIDASGSIDGVPNPDIGVTPPDESGGGLDISIDLGDGSISGSGRIVATPDLNGLVGAINGLSGQLTQLNRAANSTAGTLAEDIRAINDKFNELSNTLFDAVFSIGNTDVVSDVSTIDIENATFGKIASCENTAQVSGDIDVGGIAGAMAIEYELDPEDDVSADLSAEYRREYEMRAVVYGCTNSGDVISRRDYCGGICGRMDVGYLSRCESYGDVTSEDGSYVGGVAGLCGGTIVSDYAKCVVSGKKYVGGIVGSGITQSLSGASSSVSDCVGMVRIADAKQYFGAISGADAGDFSGNVFVSEDLAGLDARSYAGRAEPVDYETLMQDESLPDGMRRLRLRFFADDEVVEERTFEYGDSFAADDVPALPQKDDCYAEWDRTDLTDLRTDTDVNAVYTPYTTAAASATRRGDGQPVFMAEGKFQSDAVVSASAFDTQKISAFYSLDDGTDAAFEHYFASVPWYELPAEPIARNVLETWTIGIPDDGETTHKIHYRSPGASVRNIALYRLDENDEWQELSCESFGRDLVFETEGNRMQIAVVSQLSLWWAWLAVAIVALALVGSIVTLIVRAAKKRRGRKNAGMRANPADVKPKKKKKRGWIWIFLCVLLLFAATGAFLILKSGEGTAYRTLREIEKSGAWSADVMIDAAVGEEEFRVQTDLQTQTIDGKAITRTQIEDVPLYFADGAVFLENGRGYRLCGEIADYSALLNAALEDADGITLKKEEGGWRFTLSGDAANRLLMLAVPQLDEQLVQTQQATVFATINDDKTAEMTVAAQGALSDGSSFRVTAQFSNICGEADFEIPEAVTKAAARNTDSLPDMTQDLLTLIGAWESWKAQNYVSADSTLRIECGPVSLDQHFTLQWDKENDVCGVRTGGISFYLRGDTALSANGERVQTEESLANTRRIFEAAYLACLNADFDKSVRNNAAYYTIRLDEDSMDAIAQAVLPQETSDAVQLEKGSATVCVKDGEIESFAFDCTGTVGGEVLNAAASLGGEFAFTYEPFPLPERVAGAAFE